MGDDDSSQSAAVYVFEHPIWLYAPPILVPIGVAENILSVLVLFQAGLRMIPSRRTLIALSIVDALCLIVGLGKIWASIVGVAPQNLNSFLCKSISYITLVLSESSSLLVGCISVERMLAVVWPHVHQGFKNFDAIACTCVFAFVSLINVHVLATTVLIVANSTSNLTGTEVTEQYCTSNSVEAAMAVDVIDSLLLSFIPFLVISVCNSTIILRLRQHRRRFYAALQPRAPSAKAAETSDVNRARRFSMPDHRRRDARVTNTLLLVTSCFLACNLPFAVVHLIRTIGRLEMSIGWADAWIACYFLVYINNCLNFPVYVVSQSNFRRELRLLFASGCRNSERHRRALSMSLRRNQEPQTGTIITNENNLRPKVKGVEMQPLRNGGGESRRRMSEGLEGNQRTRGRLVRLRSM